MTTGSTNTTRLRARIDAAHVPDEASALQAWLDAADVDPGTRARISARAVSLVRRLRDAEEPGLLGALHGVVKRLGEAVIRVAIGSAMRELAPFDGVVSRASDACCRELRMVLAKRDGPLLPLLQSDDYAGCVLLERHVCIDSTAAGGNASLLAESSGS